MDSEQLRGIQVQQSSSSTLLSCLCLDLLQKHPLDARFQHPSFLLKCYPLFCQISLASPDLYMRFKWPSLGIKFMRASKGQPVDGTKTLPGCWRIMKSSHVLYFAQVSSCDHSIISWSGLENSSVAHGCQSLPCPHSRTLLWICLPCQYIMENQNSTIARRSYWIQPLKGCPFSILFHTKPGSKYTFFGKVRKVLQKSASISPSFWEPNCTNPFPNT